MLVTDGILLGTLHPLGPSQTSTFSVLEKHPSFCKIASVHHLVLWGIDQSDFVGWQVERIHIMPALLPSPFHQRQFPLPFSHHPWSSQVLECNSVPVFWSCPRSLFPARSSISLNWMVERSGGGRDIVVLMWIDCQTDPWHFYLWHIWSASAICH